MCGGKRCGGNRCGGGTRCRPLGVIGEVLYTDAKHSYLNREPKLHTPTIVLDKKKDKDEDSVDIFSKINTMLSDMTIGTVAMAVGVPTLFVFLLYRIIRR
jgi:hypothetical protein